MKENIQKKRLMYYLIANSYNSGGDVPHFHLTKQIAEELDVSERPLIAARDELIEEGFILAEEENKQMIFLNVDSEKEPLIKFFKEPIIRAAFDNRKDLLEKLFLTSNPNINEIILEAILSSQELYKEKNVQELNKLILLLPELLSGLQKIKK